MSDDADEDDRRLQALVQRIQEACAGEELLRVEDALTEELAASLLRAPPEVRVANMEATLALIRQYVLENP